MKKSDLQYDYPKDLIAIKPERPSRVLFNQPGQGPLEISIPELLEKLKAGDLLVLNETKVIPSRVLASSGEEFLFIKQMGPQEWEVLFPARSAKVSQVFELPGNLKAELIEKGLPQKVKLSEPIDFEYFNRFGQVNLPPYILSERREKNLNEGSLNQEDRSWYQTVWAKHVGSVAAPTASLHFSLEDLNTLEQKGVQIERLTLHVGLGTFLPLRSEDLEEHQMHSEFVSVSESLIKKATEARARGQRVWALGTTVVRALESVASGHIRLGENGLYQGESRLFIYPPYDFKLVNGLLTNFHQPESTLLALVCAFFGTKEVKDAYAYAIQKGFRLFSYGDLSVWIR